jgi:monothiol glutaredoxin
LGVGAVASWPRSWGARSFASSSHDDFAPKRKAISGEEEAMDLIKQHVQDNKVMLYMKGNPSVPMCGFSARVVQILKAEGVDFASVNVLDYPSIREGVKKFSDWPTIPQLYVDGEFIGGCDIVTSMHDSGELKDLLATADKKE